MEAIAACPKSVVAATSGVCLGGGLELAMACHARVASADAVFGLPEIFLGLTGRQLPTLPHLLGMEAAIEMILSGRRQPADQLAGTLLLDRLVEGDAVPEPILLASALAASSARCADRSIFRCLSSTAKYGRPIGSGGWTSRPAIPRRAAAWTPLHWRLCSRSGRDSCASSRS